MSLRQTCFGQLLQAGMYREVWAVLEGWNATRLSYHPIIVLSDIHSNAGMLGWWLAFSNKLAAEQACWPCRGLRTQSRGLILTLFCAPCRVEHGEESC